MEQENEYEYDDCEIDISKLTNLMKKCRIVSNLSEKSDSKSSNSNISYDTENEHNDEIPIKKGRGQHGRNKKYQHLTDEEYQAMKKRQVAEASRRYYAKNKEEHIKRVIKYYTNNRDEVIQKQSAYQKKKKAQIKIDRLEEAIEQDRELLHKTLQSAREKKQKVEQLRLVVSEKK